ncbi:MAG: hypothetical protein HND56_04540 [Pseudomonadota bacterium]|nr:hypothetical protein [Pseudomonadota bacterium]QKK05002.1 MAG: hypothetical protein HND56_04540 [Pseudomonadota bacterium]|tara:strand:- start:622 stop:2037 length:1416 start_codon:yes stop_codon:yes gene_type:complete
MADKKEERKEKAGDGRVKRAALSGIAAIILSLFLIATPYVMRSYNVSQNLSYAQTPPAPSICPYWMPCCACVFAGMTQVTTTIIEQAKEYITSLVFDQLENLINDQINNLTGGILNRGQGLEENMETWWDQFYNYDLRPALANMMAQMHTSRMDQTRQIGSFWSADGLNTKLKSLETKELKANQDARPSEHVCMAMTQAGGMGRAHAFTRAVRWGIEDERNNVGLGTAGSLGAGGSATVTQARWDRLANNFCNDATYAGTVFGADCPPSPSGYDAVDADIKPTQTVLESLTIPVKQSPNALAATEQVVENIAGIDVVQGMTAQEMDSLRGQRRYLASRARIAKRAAASSPALLSVGWRAEGSDMSLWMQEFNDRTGSSLPVSDNPSYSEIMHALTRYKPSSGTYGAEMTVDTLNLERERYIVSSIYLMQLRDYFELLERVALTLAVDTSLMLDSHAASQPSGASSAPSARP